MADTFTVTVQYPTVEFIGGTQTRNVTAVGITTKPHGVYLEFRIPDAIYSATQVNDYGLGWSGTIEQWFGVHGVTDVSWSQTVSASGELQDTYTVTVQSDSGNSAGQFIVNPNNIGLADVTAKANTLVTELNDAEGL